MMSGGNNDNNSLSINDIVIKVVPWNPDSKNLKNIKINY